MKKIKKLFYSSYSIIFFKRNSMYKQDLKIWEQNLSFDELDGEDEGKCEGECTGGASTRIIRERATLIRRNVPLVKGERVSEWTNEGTIRTILKCGSFRVYGESVFSLSVSLDIRYRPSRNENSFFFDKIFVHLRLDPC